MSGLGAWLGAWLRALLLTIHLYQGSNVAALCQNGWPVLSWDQTVLYQVGDTTKIRLAPGAPGELLAHFGRWFDKNIRDIDAGQLDDWGWAEARNVRGGTDVSNHAGGYAIDLDATKWPLGSAAGKYLTSEEIARVNQQLRTYDGVIRWGANYSGRTDPMHFEIIGTRAQVQAVWDRIRGGGTRPAAGPTLQFGSRGPEVEALQIRLARVYPAYRHTCGELVVDGIFGRITEAWVREFQRRSGLVVDGICGPLTRAALGI